MAALKRNHHDGSTKVVCDKCGATAHGPVGRTHRNCASAVRENGPLTRAVCPKCLEYEPHDYTAHTGGGYFSASLHHKDVVIAVTGRGTWRKA